MLLLFVVVQKKKTRGKDKHSNDLAATIEHGSENPLNEGEKREWMNVKSESRKKERERKGSCEKLVPVPTTRLMFENEFSITIFNNKQRFTSAIHFNIAFIFSAAVPLAPMPWTDR